MSVDTKILERIQKLLAKANDPAATPAESETFMMKAKSEMDRYNISLADVAEKDIGYDFIEVIDFGKFTLDHTLAYSICTRYFYVKGITKPCQKPGAKRRQVLQFFGESTNVQTAKHVYRTLLNAFEYLFIQYQIRTGCPQKERRGFIEAVAAGFNAKMQESLAETLIESGNSEKTGLALISQTQRLMNKYEEFTQSQGMKLQQKAVKLSQSMASAATVQAGFEQGKKLNINKSVGRSDQKRLD